jgi:hypothetical protein
MHRHIRAFLLQTAWQSLRGFGVALILFLACTHGQAQTTQGSIIGSITDTAGAVIPDATITLTNIAEGAVRVAKSNAVGDYRFLDVKPGTYSVSISAANFDKWSATGVVLTVRQSLRLDAELNIGKVQQEVQVTGESISAIETVSPTISGTFTSDAAQSLPVNTRASFSGTSAANILGTLPGMQADKSGISLQGALPYQLDVTIDGITAKNAGGGSFMGEAFP